MHIAGWKYLVILSAFINPLVSSDPQHNESSFLLGTKRKSRAASLDPSHSISSPQRESKGKKRYIVNREESDADREKEESLSQVMGLRTCGFDSSQDMEKKEPNWRLEQGVTEGHKNFKEEALDRLDKSIDFGNSSLMPPIYGGLPDRRNIIQFIEHTPAGSDKSYLTSLRETLEGQGGIQDSTVSCSITGMAGVGKTSLALAYAYKAHDHMTYDIMYWLQSDTEEKLLNGYANLLETLRFNFKGIQYENVNNLTESVNQELSSSNKKWLLVYDNVPNSLFLKGKIPLRGGHVLITSRCQEGWRHSLSLDVFRPQDCNHYFRKTLNLSYLLLEEQRSHLLAHELMYFPLLMSQAVSFISCKKYSINSYLKEFKEQYAITLSMQTHSNKVPMTPYEILINTALRMARPSLSSLAQELLRCFTYLDSDFIVKDLFIKQAEDTKYIDNAIAELSTFSLIKKNQECISLHPLLQRVMKIEQEDKNLPSYLNSIMSRLTSYCLSLGHSNVTGEERSQDEHFYFRQHLSKIKGYLYYLQQHKKMAEENLLIFKIGVTTLLELLRQQQLNSYEQAYFKKDKTKNEDRSAEKFTEKSQCFIPFKEEAPQSVRVKDHPQPTIIPKVLLLENQKPIENSSQDEHNWAARIPGALSSYLRQKFSQWNHPEESGIPSRGQGALMQFIPKVISSEGQNFIENITPLLATSIEEEVLINIISVLNPLDSDEEQRALYRMLAILLDTNEQNHSSIPLWLKELLDTTQIYRTSPTTFIHILKLSLTGINTSDPHLFESGKIILDEIVVLFGQFRKAKTNEVRNIILKKLKAYGPKAKGWAQYYIGWLYFHGLVDEGSEEEGISWYQDAANAGHKNAQFELAVFHERIPENKTQAIRLYKQAAKQGDIRAQLNLAALYEREQLKNKAKKFYKMAAQQGESRAQYKMGKIYEKGEKYEQAKTAYESAAASNYDKAQYRLGLFYEKGIGVTEKDTIKARGYYEQAARNFNPKALFKLGSYHAEGRAGLTASQEEASKLYKQAATFGNEDAFKKLGTEES